MLTFDAFGMTSSEWLVSIGLIHQQSRPLFALKDKQYHVKTAIFEVFLFEHGCLMRALFVAYVWLYEDNPLHITGVKFALKFPCPSGRLTHKHIGFHYCSIMHFKIVNLGLNGEKKHELKLAMEIILQRSHSHVSGNSTESTKKFPLLQDEQFSN